MGFFKKLVSGLSKTRNNIVSGLNSIFHGFSKIDEDFYEELEEILVMGDIGIHATEEIIENLKKKVKENHIKEPVSDRKLGKIRLKTHSYVKIFLLILLKNKWISERMPMNLKTDVP